MKARFGYLSIFSALFQPPSCVSSADCVQVFADVHPIHPSSSLSHTPQHLRLRRIC